MPDVAVKIDGKTVITSGTVICHARQIVDLFPFADDEDFRLRFDIVFYETDGESEILAIENDPNGKNGGVLKWRRKYRNGVSAANKDPLNFASDEHNDYFINAAIQTVGRFESYSLILTYTIFVSEKQ